MTDKFNFQGKLLENDSRVLTENVKFKIDPSISTSSIKLVDSERTVQIPFEGQVIKSVVASMVNAEEGETNPGVNVNLNEGVLSLQFYNLKGDKGDDGLTGPAGQAEIANHEIYSNEVYLDYDEWKKKEENKGKKFSYYIANVSPKPSPVGYVIDDTFNNKLGLCFFLERGPQGIQGPQGPPGTVTNLDIKQGNPASKFISGVHYTGSQADGLIESSIIIPSKDNLGDNFVLPITKGGTGRKDNFASNAVIIGGNDNIESLQNIETANGAFYATAVGVTPTFGTLPVAQGGTGITTSPSMTVNLNNSSAANVFDATPQPGVTGILKIANGGTGANNEVNARENLNVYSKNEVYTKNEVYSKGQVNEIIYIGEEPPTGDNTKIWIKTFTQTSSGDSQGEGNEGN